MISNEKNSSASLLPGRLLTLQSDLDTLLSNDFPNFETFKTFWRENNLSLIHHCLQPRESHQEFYQAMWGYLLNSPALRVAIYALFTLYFTQVKPKVPINIDISRWKDLLSASKSDGVVAALIKGLADVDAFSFGATVGLKTILIDRSGNPLTVRSTRKIAKCSEEPVGEVEIQAIDISQIQESARTYSMLKSDLKPMLNQRPEIYFKSPESKNELLNCLSTSSLLILDLSDPLLPLKLPMSPDSNPEEVG